MRYAVATLILAAAATLLAQSSGSAPASHVTEPAVQQEPMFRSASSELVVLPVSVTDDRGRLVPNLPQDRFVVYDEGQRQEVVAFSSEDTPVSIALVIDDSGSMRNKIGEVAAATLAFARASHPEDELLVVEFNDSVRDALDGRRITAADTPALDATLRTLSPAGQTALYDALTDGLEHLDSAVHARRVLILISDGGDNISRATLDEVLDRARRSNVTIYSIGLFDDGTTDANPGVLKRLADATGGQRFLPRSPGPLLTACELIAHEIRSSYTIGYAPQARDGRFHRLKVDVAGPGLKGLKVRTRPGYVAAAQGTR